MGYGHYTYIQDTRGVRSPTPDILVGTVEELAQRLRYNSEMVSERELRSRKRRPVSVSPAIRARRDKLVGLDGKGVKFVVFDESHRYYETLAPARTLKGDPHGYAWAIQRIFCCDWG